MKTEIEKAIKVLTEKISNNTTADEALKFTQAIVNIANAQKVIENWKVL